MRLGVVLSVGVTIWQTGHVTCRYEFNSLDSSMKRYLVRSLICTIKSFTIERVNSTYETRFIPVREFS